MLANRADCDYGQCYPSLKKIALECGISRRSVIRHIQTLEAKGYLKIKRQKKDNKDNYSNLYTLPIDGDLFVFTPSDSTSLGDFIDNSPSDNESPPSDTVTPPSDSGTPGGSDTVSPKTVNNKQSNNLSLKQSNNLSNKYCFPEEKPVNDSGYTEDFERAWKLYPKRAGSNSKEKAYKQWIKRLSDGKTGIEEIISGIERYKNFCEQTGKINTELVQQASRFLGLEKGYLQDWLLPSQNNKFTRQTKFSSVTMQNIEVGKAWLDKRRAGNE